MACPPAPLQNEEAYSLPWKTPAQHKWHFDTTRRVSNLSIDRKKLATYDSTTKNSAHDVFLTVTHGDGGSPEKPLQIPKTELEGWCRTTSFPMNLLNKFDPPITHCTVQERRHSKHVEGISAAIGLFNHQNLGTIILISHRPVESRYDCFVALNGYLEDSRELQSLVAREAELFSLSPLCLIAAFLDHYRRAILYDFRDLNSRVNQAEIELLREHSDEWLIQHGHRAGGKSFEEVNADLFYLQKHLAFYDQTYKSLQLFGNYLQRHGRIHTASLGPPENRVRKAVSDLLFSIQVDLNRSSSFRNRLDATMSLLYNRNMLFEARQTKEISLATKRDSNTMRTLAIVAMLYLPSTFISEVFAATVFNDVILSKVGIGTFVGTCIALTLLTFLGWYFFNRAGTSGRTDLEIAAHKFGHCEATGRTFVAEVCEALEEAR